MLKPSDLTVGPVRQHLVRMGLFMLVAMLVQTAYSIIDIYWVSRLGREAVAAVAIGTNLMMAVLALTQVLSVGTVSQVSRAAGARDKALVATLFNQSQMFGAVLGLVFAGAAWLIRIPYCSRQAGDPVTAQLAADFLLWFVPALFLQFPMMGLGAALRGVGDMRTVAVTQAGTIGLNIVLAPFLIFGWGTGHAYGVAGAAMATLLSMLIGVTAMLVVVYRRGTYFDTARGSWAPQLPIWGRILKTGLPSGMEFGVMALYFGFILAVIRPFGAGAQAAFGIGMRVMQIGMLPAIALAFAGSAVAGQNYGAKLPARVRECHRASTIIAVTTCTVLMLPMLLFPTQIMRLFSDDPSVLDYGTDFLRMLPWNLVASAFIFPCFSIFNGFGNTVPSLIASASRIGFIIVAVSWLATLPDFRIHEVWQLSIVGTILQAVLNLWFVRRAFRKHLTPLEAGATGTEPGLTAS